MIVPHDRLASFWCYDNVAIVTVLHQIELVYFHGVEVSLWRWDEVSSSSWISEYNLFFKGQISAEWESLYALKVSIGLASHPRGT